MSLLVLAGLELDGVSELDDDLESVDLELDESESDFGALGVVEDFLEAESFL